MVKGKIFKILKAPSDWEVIQQNNGFADVEIIISVEDNPDDDTDFEIPFSFDKIYARIVNEESGEFITPPVKLEKSEEGYGCSVKNIPCGGPYLLDMILFDRECNTDYTLIGEKRRHFFVGDVYIIAGQSNAAGMAKGFLTETAEQGVHVLRNMKYWDIASQPFNDFDYSRHGMFLSFAKKIKKITGMPVGLIPAAMGGAPLSRWLKDEDGDLYSKLTDTLKTNGIKARAMLWYQGCADSGDSEYLKRFERFVKIFRRDLKNGEIPIFTFQLNRQRSKDESVGLDEAYDIIREAQREAAKKIKNLYVISTADSNMSDFIHNGRSANITLGERLASEVLNKLYGIGMGAAAPEIERAYFVSSKEILIGFSNVSEYLCAYQSTVSEFPIKVDDSKGRVGLEDYEISANTVKLLMKRETEGETFVSGQTGADPRNIITDYGTQIPMLCFYKFKVEGNKNGFKT